MNTTFDLSYFDDGVWRLKPDEWPEEDENADWPNALTAWVEQEFASRKKCPYCRTELGICEYFEEAETGISVQARIDAPDLARLWACRHCAYWQWYSVFENRGLHGSAAMSVLREFDPTIPDGCWIELAQHLRRNEGLWQSLHPTAMERLVAELFRANFADAEVIHVGRPGDLGTDVLFIDASGVQWLIQVKRRARNGAVEGFETLQKLLGTLALEGQRRGIIASNASHFSFQSRQQAHRASQRGFVIELLDRGKLDRMVGALLPQRPWQALLKDMGIPLELEERFDRVLSGSGTQMDLTNSSPLWWNRSTGG